MQQELMQKKNKKKKKQKTTEINGRCFSTWAAASQEEVTKLFAQSAKLIVCFQSTASEITQPSHSWYNAAVSHTPLPDKKTSRRLGSLLAEQLRGGLSKEMEKWIHKREVLEEVIRSFYLSYI